MQKFGLEIYNIDKLSCWVITNGVAHKFAINPCWSPFMSLLYFVKAVATQRLPAKFFVDEEGVGIHFLATPLGQDRSLMHLKVHHDEEPFPWFDEDIEREQVVQAMLLPILDLFDKDPSFRDEWELIPEEVQKIRATIRDGLPLRSDTHSAQPIEFLYEGGELEELYDGWGNFSVCMLDEKLFIATLYDSDPFWKEWFHFLKKVALGDLPAQCVNIFTYNDEAPFYYFSNRFRALPVDVPENFRLEVISHDRTNGLFLELDEVVNRRQCVEAFAQEYRKLMRHYMVMPDKHGNTFDLRTLRFDRLLTGE